ncbi:uncharacterized protein LOC126285048 [Schistocerca gregaria]|uniref:uncharacterized protein LOC126285048 n=1 Tax=Schistocerca gregaria TaxID=7010 RepID=UPI00211E357F|nr:uncharacterized protein LOC126285048 [Schistocerca gregaria]
MSTRTDHVSCALEGTDRRAVGLAPPPAPSVTPLTTTRQRRRGNDLLMATARNLDYDMDYSTDVSTEDDTTRHSTASATQYRRKRSDPGPATQPAAATDDGFVRPPRKKQAKKQQPEATTSLPLSNRYDVIQDGGTAAADDAYPNSYKELYDWLKSNLKQPFTAKQAGGDKLKLSVATTDDYMTVMDMAGARGIPSYTFPMVRPPTLKIVLRGVVQSLSNEDVKDELAELGFHASIVDYHKMPGTNKRSGLRVVILPDTPDNRKIFNVTRLCALSITVETLRKSRGVTQCFRCQGFSHVARHCTMPFVCVKCGGPHDSRLCPVPKQDPAKCGLCGGNHTANFRSCPKHKEASRRQRGLPPLTAKERNRRTNVVR